MRNTFVKSLLGASVLAIMTASTAFAQEAPKVEEKKENAKANSDSKAKGETVVITGSRIRKDSFNQASPLQVVTNVNSILAGNTDAADIVQGSTAAAGSTQINNFFNGFVVEGGPGIQTVGLNSLGAQRTLVLLNGRRLPPSGTRGQTGAVDLQTIPNLAVNRYEILNEGASPIYGSDAVGGVVNAITRKDADGFEMNVSSDFTFDGGGANQTIGALWGKTADKWNVMISGQYFETKALKYKDRDFCAMDFVFDPNTGARVDYIDPATGKPFCLGINGTSFNRVTPTAGTNAAGTGTWVVDPTATSRVFGINPQTGAANTLLKVPGYKRLFSPPTGTIGTPVTYQVDYTNKWYENTDIISPSKRTNLFATFNRDLDFFGGAEFYSEVVYAKRESSQERGAQLFFVAPATNPYNPWGTAFGGTSAAQPVIARPANGEQTVETWQVLAGLTGNTNNGFGGFLKNGNWDIYGQISEGKGKYGGTTIRQDRLNATLATTITNGVASCPTPTYGGTCLPINFFDPRVLDGNYTQAEYDYLFGAENIGTTVYKQDVFEANISGDVFQIPGAADAIKANFGVHYRKYSLNDTPGVETLRGNTALSSAAGITKGDDAVKEVYTEFAAPLIAKKPLIEDLTWTGAYRYTDYDSYDSNSTWKSTLSWRITPELQVVAISGTSYRAPALFELFLADQTGFLSQTSIDPCIDWGLSNNQLIQQRCAAEGFPPDFFAGNSSATIIQKGGFGRLKEEESRSDIFSVIWRPTFANLDARVDMWKINVADQVTNFGGSIVGACYGIPNETTRQYFCNKFTRNSSGLITTVNASYENIDRQDVEGIDLKLVYKKEFPLGDLIIDSQNRWTLKNVNELFPGADPSDTAGDIGDPVYNSTTQVRFDHKDWTFAWTANATGPASYLHYYGSDTLPLSPTANYAFKGLTSLKYKMDVETTITHDFAVRYRNDNWTLVGGISNIFDEQPPYVSSGIYFGRLGTSPTASQYDFVGRSGFINLTRRF